MSTRSTIAVQHGDKSVSQIYCHWDGYISRNGVLLLNHYNSREKASELISHGDISSLGKRIYPINELSTHSFDFPENGTTVYYHRDRGDRYIKPRKFDSVEKYFYLHEYQEYEYIYCTYIDVYGKIVEGWLVSFYDSKNVNCNAKGYIPLDVAVKLF